jgi:hypothetical protein
MSGHLIVSLRSVFRDGSHLKLISRKRGSPGELRYHEDVWDLNHGRVGGADYGWPVPQNRVPTVWQQVGAGL